MCHLQNFNCKITSGMTQFIHAIFTSFWALFYLGGFWDVKSMDLHLWQFEVPSCPRAPPLMKSMTFPSSQTTWILSVTFPSLEVQHWHSAGRKGGRELELPRSCQGKCKFLRENSHSAGPPHALWLVVGTRTGSCVRLGTGHVAWMTKLGSRPTGAHRGTEKIGEPKGTSGEEAAECRALRTEG